MVGEDGGVYLRAVERMQIGPEHWGIQEVIQALEQASSLSFSRGAMDAVARCVRFLEAQMAVGGGKPVYGVNTGFGDLAYQSIPEDQLAQLQKNILLSHACGVGDPVPEQVVRTMLLLKLKALVQGHSGVRQVTLDRLLDWLRADCLPRVPSQGSLGASGDLAPLAHLVLPLIGQGELRHGGGYLPASTVLKAQGWEPLTLGPKEGLALINGTQLMLAYGVQSVLRIARVAAWADALAAWSLEAWHGRSEPFHPAIHRVRGHEGARVSAAQVRAWLAGSEQQQEPRTQVQDPYSFRCVPQVHGASRDAWKHAERTLEREINAVTDNPLIFPEEGLILSGGNFHGQPLALVFDYLALAVHEWGSISERRTFKLLSGRQGLPPFLVAEPGLNSGWMIPQYTAASLVSQSKQLCTPASADTIDSSNGQEDHVSMGANGALKLWRILDNVEQVLAIEALTAAQACDLRGTRGMAPGLLKLQSSLRERVPHASQDVYLHPLLIAGRDWMFYGAGNALRQEIESSPEFRLTAHGLD
jgi:histidine ammonia-lyase